MDDETSSDCRSARRHTAHHFVVDLVEVDLADFLHDVLVLKRHKAETCLGGRGEYMRGHISHSALDSDSRLFSAANSLQ